jgi:hypothetical protein
VNRSRNRVTFGGRSEPAASLLLFTIPTGIPHRRASRPARLVGLGVDAIPRAVHSCGCAAARGLGAPCEIPTELLDAMAGPLKAGPPGGWIDHAVVGVETFLQTSPF